MPASLGQSVRATREFDDPWVEQGICRSATFRDLVAELDRSDVIVYVQPRFLSMESIAGGLQLVSVTPSARILRIVINLKVFGTDRFGAIATLGHELRHALEVANAAEIKNVETFTEYYRRHQVLATIREHRYPIIMSRSIAPHDSRPIAVRKSRLLADHGGSQTRSGPN